MDNFSPASSQKAEDCPISFILDDQSGGGGLDSVTLYIRPEDMTRVHPSRLSVNQTLDGAWIDSFGEGLEKTTISGILGWRTGADGKDGATRLQEMREKVYHAWHTRRKAAIERGNDPNKVKLFFVDALNDYIRIVAPEVFEIKRNKSRPLLGSYRIAFTAVGGGTIAGVKLTSSSLGLPGVDPSGFGLDSLMGSINSITTSINGMTAWVNKTVLAPVQAFMRLTSRVLTTVHTLINSGQALAGSLMNVARAITQAGVNVFRTFAAIIGIPAAAKAALMGVASAYSNSFCVLRNALRSLATYEDYNNLYGSSNCSSTAGGSPPSPYLGTNAFFAVAPSVKQTVGVSVPASTNLSALSKSDTVLAPMTPFQIGSALSSINSGVILSI